MALERDNVTRNNQTVDGSRLRVDPRPKAAQDRRNNDNNSNNGHNQPWTSFGVQGSHTSTGAQAMSPWLAGIVGIALGYVVARVYYMDCLSRAQFNELLVQRLYDNLCMEMAVCKQRLGGQ